MKAVIVGCGRVGSAVALQLAGEGWDVTCIDENETALSRLGDWRGGFVVGHALEIDVLEQAGIAEADAAVVATDGDNTNLVVGQVIRKRYQLECVLVRVLDPKRADFYATQGLRTVCPTKTTISTMIEGLKTCAPRVAEAG